MESQVIFTYHEASKKWSTTVVNVKSHQDAQDAFVAVVKTCQKLPPDLLMMTKVHVNPDGVYEITPVMRG